MKKDVSPRRLLTTSILLLMVAIAGITAATTAWITIADRTRVNTLRMEVTSGINLRIDLDPHATFKQYKKSLSFEEIAARIEKVSGFSPKYNPLTPVTTKDCETFTLERGAPARPEYYLDFTLHFMASAPMVVHLTTEGADGTAISSPYPAVPPAMRLSFTAEETSVYDPGMKATYEPAYGGKVFGLAKPDEIVYDDSNALFSLKAYQNKAVRVRIWLEGTDPNCTDALRGAEYSIQLRFVGTDKNGKVLVDSRNIKIDAENTES